MSTFLAVYTAVHNRGIPPQSFIETLTTWVRTADPEIFSETYRGSEPDVYDSILQRRPDLTGMDRAALMCEVLRVLAGFEASWRWTEGRHVTNPTSDTPRTTEAGIFQVSGNSLVFSPTLTACFLRHGGRLISGKPDYPGFQRLMKENKQLALEYAARLLRFTIRHNGPVARGEIHLWLRAASVLEFAQITSPPPVALDAGRVELNQGLQHLDELLDG